MRVRVVHSVVMVLLYKRGASLKENAKFIWNAASEHGINLGIYSFLFRFLRCQLVNHLGLSRGRASLLVGTLLGALIWGRRKTPIAYQVVLYVLSRIVVGSVHHQVNEGRLPNVNAFRVLAALVWGYVMYLFTVDPKALHGALRSSIEFIFNDEKFSNPPNPILPFIPFSGI